ncbi:MAG: AAA family ATPase, partial [Clostridiales bacterium]|nr:AAA family ATPase [Clostridiales bacterium]
PLIGSVFICTETYMTVVRNVQMSVIEELREAYPLCVREKEEVLANALFAVSHKTGNKFIVIIDEWDALFREAKDDMAIQKEYVQLLRGLFKGGPSTDETIAAAYMTGILPIKKYGTESALTDFQEFTMTSPAKLARYVGFTEAEVKKLCKKYHMDFESMQTWYDGYSFHRVQHVYNPNSVMLAIRNEEFQNYWTSSETYESLKKYIEMDFDGLKGAIVSMLGGEAVRVKISTFQNDMTSFHSKDDVLTLLIHLGYLTYDSKTCKATIPNLEVADAFGDAVSGEGWAYVATAIQDSDDLLEATRKGDCEKVATALGKTHESVASVLEYNNEASLSAAVILAYYTARRYYEVRIIEFPVKNVKTPDFILRYQENSAILQCGKIRFIPCEIGIFKEKIVTNRISGGSYNEGKYCSRPVRRTDSRDQFQSCGCCEQGERAWRGEDLWDASWNPGLFE